MWIRKEEDQMCYGGRPSRRTPVQEKWHSVPVASAVLARLFSASGGRLSEVSKSVVVTVRDRAGGPGRSRAR